MSFLLRNLLKQLTISSSKGLSVSFPVLSSKRAYSNKVITAENAAPYEVVDSQQEKILCQEILSKVKNQIANKDQGRLFAVVHLVGKQFKITEGDIIIIENYWPPLPGDKIKLDKVLLVGAQDFTLIGRPLVQDGLVDIIATVIEKTLSHTKTNFKKKRRKQYTNINFYRGEQTMLRINNITLKNSLDNPPDVTGLEHRIM